MGNQSCLGFAQIVTRLKKCLECHHSGSEKTETIKQHEMLH